MLRRCWGLLGDSCPPKSELTKENAECSLWSAKLELKYKLGNAGARSLRAVYVPASGGNIFRDFLRGHRLDRQKPIFQGYRCPRSSFRIRFGYNIWGYRKRRCRSRVSGKQDNKCNGRETHFLRRWAGEILQQGRADEDRRGVLNETT